MNVKTLRYLMLTAQRGGGMGKYALIAKERIMDDAERNARLGRSGMTISLAYLYQPIAFGLDVHIPKGDNQPKYMEEATIELLREEGLKVTSLDIKHEYRISWL